MAHSARWSWVTDSKALGESLRNARRDRGLQQADVAERIMVSRMTISRMERGEPVAMDTVLRAMAECGVALVMVPKFARVRVSEG